MQSEKGFSLIETLIALALMGIIAVTVLMGMTTAFRAATVSQERVAAESLAKSQLEFIKIQNYITAADYDPNDTLKCYAPIDIYDGLVKQGYTIAINPPQTIISPGAHGYEVQSVTVVVRRNGEEMLTTSCFRLGRVS
jgi:prepilin-type N-terminal cleavage/methylation domain-containing protein